MQPALLSTKLYFPPLRQSIVPRPRLVDRFQVGIQGRLTLLSAPAGSGKTTLLSEWHSGTGAGFPVAWLSLSPGDNDLGRFLAYLCSALDQLQPGLAEEVEPVLQAVQVPNHEIILTDVINLLSSLENESVLVLDDYHLVENREIHLALAFLLENLPPRLHLVLLTRADPPLPLAGLRARGQLTEIRTDQLRFNVEECRQFLSQVMGLNLTAEQVLALERRTEGWIAGLQLAALSMQGRQDLDGFISAFTGSHHYIVDYLADEVLSRQPEAVRDFLMKTSILERLSGPLCDAVLGDQWDRQTGAGQSADPGDQGSQGPYPPLPSNSQTVLDYLEKSNLFVIPLDEGRRWYRYHHLFADLLRNRLRSERPASLSELHCRAAGWFEKNALWFEALEHLLAAGEYQHACHLIGENVLAIMRELKVPPLIHWIKSMPESVVREDPRVCLLYGYVQELVGEIDSYESYVQSAEKALSQSTQRFPPGSPVYADVLAEIKANQADLAVRKGNFADALNLTTQALATAQPGAHFIRSVAYLNASWAKRELGEIEDAVHLCEQALLEARQDRHPGMIAGAITSLGSLLRSQGHWQSAVQISLEGLEYARKMGQDRLAVYAIVYYELARAYYELNELKKAEEHTEQGLRLSKQGLRPRETLEGQALQVWLLRCQGNLPGARQSLERAALDEQAAGIFQSHEDLLFQFHQDLAYYQARLNLDAGRTTEAEAWVSSRTAAAGDRLGYRQGIQALRQAHLLLGLERLDEAIDLLEQVAAAAENGGCAGWQIEALCLLAVAWRQKGHPTQALWRLQKALALAEPEGAIRVFLDAGPSMIELLRIAQKRGLSTEFSARLAAAFVGKGQGKAVQAAPARGLLSRREAELLRLIAQGFSNKEIAAQLVISVGTVKRHLVHIFTKLDVSNRTEAAAKARELGLLED